jgi:hypothetical protein
MPALPMPDAQTLAALAIGLLAMVHLIRRWWPQWRRLWAPAAPANAASGACGTGTNPNPSGGTCGSGCGQCGSATPMPTKDHRIHIVRRPSH